MTVLRILGEDILQNTEWFFNSSFPCSVPKWKTLQLFLAPLFLEKCFSLFLCTFLLARKSVKPPSCLEVLPGPAERLLLLIKVTSLLTLQTT